MSRSLAPLGAPLVLLPTYTVVTIVDDETRNSVVVRVDRDVPNRREEQNQMTTTRPRPGIASKALTAALLDLAQRRQHPRCAEPATRHLWLSDRTEERDEARRHCAGCPILIPCLEAAIEEDERWAVRGACDFRHPVTQRAAKRQRQSTAPATPAGATR